MGRKLIKGLTSNKVALLLNISAQEFTAEYSADGADLTLSP